MSSVPPVQSPSEPDFKRRKQTVERAKANHLTKQLQMRLQYARLKVEHGWQRQNLNEVENLYFHHSHIRRPRQGTSYGKPSTSTQSIPSSLSGTPMLIDPLSNSPLRGQPETGTNAVVTSDSTVQPYQPRPSTSDSGAGTDAPSIAFGYTGGPLGSSVAVGETLTTDAAPAGGDRAHNGGSNGIDSGQLQSRQALEQPRIPRPGSSVQEKLEKGIPGTGVLRLQPVFLTSQADKTAAVPLHTPLPIHPPSPLTTTPVGHKRNATQAFDPPTGTSSRFAPLKKPFYSPTSSPPIPSPQRKNSSSAVPTPIINNPSAPGSGPFSTDSNGDAGTSSTHYKGPSTAAFGGSGSSTGSLTYDSFWSSHSTTTTSYRNMLASASATSSMGRNAKPPAPATTSRPGVGLLGLGITNVSPDLFGSGAQVAGSGSTVGAHPSSRLGFEGNGGPADIGGSVDDGRT